MYTQCPECNTAFRITADVLKQAAGKVRCGSCGNAFNALEYLSESLPEAAPQTDAEDFLPELKPESGKGNRSLPSSISAEQSAALLKTLDELAGSDIRIEDTGVEWRVMDGDEIGHAADDASLSDEPAEDQPQIDELLDASPTPVDQFLTSTPTRVDSPEIFEQAAATAADELRFDDNTPLPDDFDFTAEPEVEPAGDREVAREIEQQALADFELSEPDEWTDILNEFEDLIEAAGEPAVADELEALTDTGGDIDTLLEGSRDGDAPPDEPVILPPTEEEQTINRMIDQELLALAVEDDEGFASTIVMPGEAVEAGANGERPDSEMAQEPGDTGAGFETIIMEGEHIRSALDEDTRDQDKEEAARLLSAAAAERDAQHAAQGGKSNVGMIAAAIVLLLLLGAQLVHRSRDALATIPAFNDVAGPVYRALGQPLAPAWDVTGWRFEVTRGNTDEAGENLAIYSRIGNKSARPLPYPLVGISLTDRFEDVIGSRVLDPADYLATDLDPRKLVEPGDTFNAVISIPSPSAEATGFKLNVCYRETGGKLRCAVDDFK